MSGAKNNSLFVLVVQALIEPLAFALGIFASCVVLLSSLGENFLKILDIVDVSDNNNAVSDVLGILIPISMITIFSMALGMVSFLVRVLLSDRESVSVMHAASLLVATIVLVFLLVVCILVNVLEFKDTFDQSDRLDPERLREIKLIFLFNLLVAFFAILFQSFNDAIHRYLSKIQRPAQALAKPTGASTE